MTLTLIAVFTFRFHSDGGTNRPGFLIEYITQNCGNNVCNTGRADNKFYELNKKN